MTVESDGDSLGSDVSQRWFIHAIREPTVRNSVSVELRVDIPGCDLSGDRVERRPDGVCDRGRVALLVGLGQGGKVDVHQMRRALSR